MKKPLDTIIESNEGFSWIFYDTENPMILNTKFFMGWISWIIKGAVSRQSS